jgi:hypothetical protein
MEIAGMTGAVPTRALSVQYDGDRGDTRPLHDSDSRASEEQAKIGRVTTKNAVERVCSQDFLGWKEDVGDDKILAVS